MTSNTLYIYIHKLSPIGGKIDNSKHLINDGNVLAIYTQYAVTKRSET